MPKVVDHDRYRSELLAKSLDLFAAKGYGAITMRQIAIGLGVSTGTLYHYFSSKESLFEQLVGELSQRDIQAFLDRAPATERLEDRLDAVLDFVRLNRDYFAKQMLLWIEFFQHSRRTQVENPAVLREVWEETIGFVMNYLQIQDRMLLDSMFIFVDGLMVQQIYGFAKTDDTFEQQLGILRNMLLQGLAESRQSSSR